MSVESEISEKEFRISEIGQIQKISVLKISSIRKWEKIFKDPMTTAAAIDRLVHHSIILELNLSSYRLEESKTKINKEKDTPSHSSTNN